MRDKKLSLLTMGMVFQFVFPVAVFPEDLECRPGPEPGKEIVHFGYVKQVHRIPRAGGLQVHFFARWDGKQFQSSDGAMTREQMPVWLPLEPERPALYLAGVYRYVNHLGNDHCEHVGFLPDRSTENWTLVTSVASPGLPRSPTESERARFYQINTDCIVQGDPGLEVQPPCTRPELQAVSDADGDGHPEYWFTEPYLWDTGFSIAEMEDDTLNGIIQSCVGCSD